MISFEKNVVALASAGTGKTHNLVGWMLHALLVKKIDPAKLVATTFSRRAAGEMRARLRSELERIGTEASKYPDLASEAKTAARVLDRLHRARISTLHSFAFDLVRDRALEAGLPPGFTLSSDDEEREALAQAVLRALAYFGDRDPDLLRGLATIMGTGEQLAERLTNILVDIQEDATMGLLAPSDDAAVMDEQMKRMEEIARALDRDFHYFAQVKAMAGAKSDEARASAAAEMLAQRAPRNRTTAQEDLYTFSKDPMLPRVPGAKNKEMKANAFALAYEMRSELGKIAQGAAKLLERALAEARAEEARSARIGFGAVLRAARDLLKDRPDIAKEIASNIDVLFVDEFQDTSRVQCEMVTLLWDRDHARAPGTMPRELRPNGLFVVGDRKQSIYGFRGADVAVFSSFCALVAGDPARIALGLPRGSVAVPDHPTGELVTLKHNWRSRAELIAFTNAIAPHVLVPASDESFEARYVKETEDLLAPNPSEGDARVTWLRWKDGPRKATVAEEARAIAQRIDAIVRSGRAPKDIAILARTNEMLDAAAHELARLAIPHIVGGRGFFRAREVRDMLAMLSAIVRPLDRRALVEVARGIWTGASDGTLLSMVEPGRGLALVEDWRDRAKGPREECAALERTADVILRLRRAIDRIGPANALREAIAALDVEATLLLLPRGAQRLANVRKLVSMIEREPSVLALLDRVERISLENREPEAATFSEEDDAVRLLTVHASKGLDFPIVFVPQIASDAGARATPAIFASRTEKGPVIVSRVPRPGGRSIEPPSFRRAQLRELARDRADRKRLSYVAITRASEAMYLVGDRPDPKEGTLAHAVLHILGSNTVRVEEITLDAARVPSREEERVTIEIREREPPPRPRMLPIATTALSDFHHCARRFELAHLLGMPEVARLFDGDLSEDLSAREEGTLSHRVLERIDFARPEDIALWLDREHVPKGASRDRIHERVRGFLETPYVARILREKARVIRERPFVLPIEANESTLLLKGTIDLVVEWPDARMDIIDYKRSFSNLELHAFQLDAYVLALRTETNAAVRAGISHLGGKPEPRFRASPDDDQTRRTLSALARRLILARENERFPRIEQKGCRALRCGYEPLCHPRRAGTQLGLFGS